jgi:hypothetical protein
MGGFIHLMYAGIVVTITKLIHNTRHIRIIQNICNTTKKKL